MADDEGFGSDDQFGDAAIEAAPEVETEYDPLLAVIEEAQANLEAAQAMGDEMGVARFQKIIDTCNEQNKPVTAPASGSSMIESEDWTFLENACIRVWGEEAGKKWLAACREQKCAYVTIYNDVAPHLKDMAKIPTASAAVEVQNGNKDKAAPKRRTPREKKEVVAATEAPQQEVNPYKAAFDSAVKIATENGVLDAHLVWDELGLAELSEPNLKAFAAELDQRVAALAEGFGGEQPTQESSGIEHTEAPKQDWLAGRVNEETGEVDIPGLLQKLRWSEMPQQLSKDQAEQIIDIIVSRRSKAQRHEDQIKKIVEPLRKSADFYEETFGNLLDKFFESNQRRKANGEFDGKTMELRTGTLSYRGTTGGLEIGDEGAFHTWLRSVDKPSRELYGISLEYTITADEAIALGISDKLTEMGRKAAYEYDRKKLIASVNRAKEPLPPTPGMIKTVAQPLKTRTIE